VDPSKSDGGLALQEATQNEKNGVWKTYLLIFSDLQPFLIYGLV
jgi:hypothetical protein